MRACFHCGELFEEGKLVCPHCGADADFTYAEEPNEFAFDEPDEPEPQKRAGCSVLLLALVVCGGAILLL